MKTVTEMKNNRSETVSDARRLHLERCRELVESCEKVPVLHEKHSGNRQVLRGNLLRGKVHPLDIACDHCGTEVVDRNPGRKTASLPPKRSVGCPGCGWYGHIPV